MYSEDDMVLKPREMSRAITRIASEILEDTNGCDNLIIVGILDGGVPIAELIAEQIKRLEGIDISLGSVDITLYRDDLSQIAELPVVGETVLPCDINGTTLILVDDVLFTGRTVRAAIENIISFGRPDQIRLAVLIDRGERELPIQPDFTGKTIELDKKSVIEVFFSKDGNYAAISPKKQMGVSK